MTAIKPVAKTIEKQMNRRTEYQRLLARLKKRGPQPWVKSKGATKEKNDD